MLGRSEEEPSPQARIGGVTTTPVAGTPTGEEPSGPREGLILLLFTILTVAATAFLLYSEEQRALDDPAQKAKRGEIRGLEGLSLVREENFARVLKKVEASEWPLVASVRLAPGSAEVTAQNGDGEQKILTYDPGFEVTEGDFGTSTNDAVPTKALDAGAPQRMVRGVSERSGRGVDDLDYVTTSFLTQRQPTWTIALAKGPAKERLWVAEFDGRDVRRVGEPSKAQRNEAERNQRRLEANQRRIEATQRRIRQRAACLSRATGAEDASRCLQRFPP